jgi:hypothetical protein
MKIIKIDEFNFKMIDDDREIIIKRKENEDFLRLEENSLNRKFIQISRFEKSNEIELKKINRNSENSQKSEKSEKSDIFDFEKYLDEDDMKILKELKLKSFRNFKIEMKLKENSKYSELLNIKKKFDELIEIKFIDENNSDYLRIKNEIKKMKEENYSKLLEEILEEENSENSENSD